MYKYRIIKKYFRNHRTELQYVFGVERKAEDGKWCLLGGIFTTVEDAREFIKTDVPVDEVIEEMEE